MTRKKVLYFFIGCLICLIIIGFIIYLIDLYYTPGHLELVSYDYEINYAELKWHGINGTKIRLYGITAENIGILGTVDASEYRMGSRTVNDGETFILWVPDVRIEIYYHHTKVRVERGGDFWEEPVFFPSK